MTKRIVIEIEIPEQVQPNEIGGVMVEATVVGGEWYGEATVVGGTQPNGLPAIFEDLPIAALVRSLKAEAAKPDPVAAMREWAGDPDDSNDNGLVYVLKAYADLYPVAVAFFMGKGFDWRVAVWLAARWLQCERGDLDYFGMLNFDTSEVW